MTVPIPTPQEIRQMYLDTGVKPAKAVFGITGQAGVYVCRAGEGSLEACAIGVCLIGSPTTVRGIYGSFALKYDISVKEAITFARQFDGHEMATADSTYWDAVKDLV